MDTIRRGFGLFSLLLAASVPSGRTVSAQAPVVAPFPAPPPAVSTNRVEILAPAPRPATRHASEAAGLVQDYNQLERQVAEMASRYRGAGDDGRPGIRDEIARLTRRQFELRERYRREEVERLRQRLAKVEKTLRQRQEHKQDIVQQRVGRLLNEETRLGWEPLRGNTVSSIRVDPVAPPPAGSPAASRAGWPALAPARQHTADASPMVSPAEPPSPQYADDFTMPSAAEAHVELEYAQRERDRVQALFDTGAAGVNELERVQQRVKHAELAVSRAQAAFKAKRKLLELDLRKADVELEAAKQDLEKQNNPFGVPRSRGSNTEYELKRLALERAKTLLELHIQSDTEQPETAEPETPADDPVPPVDGVNRPAGSTIGITRLEADVDAAERRLSNAERMFERGYISDDELSRAKFEVQLSRAALAQGRAELNSKRQLAELRIREAQLELEAATRELDRILKMNEGTPVVAAAAVQQARTDVQRRELALERAKINLEAR